MYEADEFMDRVMEFAQSLAALDPDAVGLAKLTIDLCTAEDREKTRHIERIANTALGGGAPDPGMGDALRKTTAYRCCRGSVGRERAIVTPRLPRDGTTPDWCRSSTVLPTTG